MKISIPTVELTQEEWDQICEVLMQDFGYTTRAECRDHFRSEASAYAHSLCEKWSYYNQ